MQNFFQSLPALLNGFNREVFLITKEGRLAFHSDQCHEILDYEKGQLGNKTILEVNPNFSKLGWKRFWRSLSKTEWQHEETELISKAGIIFPVTVDARLFYWEDKYYCCYIWEAHQRAHRFEELLTLTSKVSRIGAWSLDLVTNEVSFTAETARLLSLPTTGFENQISAISFFRHFYRILDQDDWKRLRADVKRAIYQGTSFEVELNIQQDNGELHRYNVHTLVQYSDEKASQLYGTIQDISSLVERSEDMYMAQYTVDHAHEMIFWLKKDGSITFVNELTCNTLGYTRSELLSHRKAFDLSPDFPLEVWKDHWENLRKNKVLEVETELKHKNGELIPVLATIIHLHYQGEEYNISYVRDLRTKRQRDELLQLTQHTIDHSHDLILWFTPDAQIFFSNETAKSVLGYSETDLAKLKFTNLFDPAEEDLFFDKIWERISKDQELEINQKIKTKNNKLIPVEVFISLLQLHGKNYVCLTMRNLSEKAKRDTELRRAYAQIKALKEKIEGERDYLQEEVSNRYKFSDIVTKSPQYRQVLRQLTQVADTSTTVLILGETGTGKELLARAIHELSDRDDQPLVKVNCAALPENLIESELFGHEKGAFTGAYQRKIGRFELADEGTIFLDEIGEMPLALQTKLLRVLQEGEFQRVGGTETRKVDVRVIAATNRDLARQVQERNFRQDLYFRLNVFPINNLPLRERKEDIPLLIQHFMKKYADKIGRDIQKIPKAGVAKLMQYEFPGNVRELENIVERAVVLSQKRTLNLEAVLPTLMQTQTGQPAKFQSLEEIQREHIIEALNRTHWKVTGKGSASELLQINGKTLASRMRKLGISRPQFSR